MLIRIDEQTFINPDIVGTMRVTEGRDDKGFKWRISLKNLKGDEIYSLEVSAELANREKITSTRARLSTIINKLAPNETEALGST